MLSSSKISSASAKDYAAYLTEEELVLEPEPGTGGMPASYYADEGSAWHGSDLALGRAGLTDCRLDAAIIEAALRGRHPVSNTQLRDPGGAARTVNSHDLTFAAPKSFSVAWAASDELQRRALEQMLYRAHAEAIEYLTANMPCIHQRVPGNSKKRERVPAQELVYGTILHRTARPTPDAAPDPHLHIHTLVVGAIRDHDGAFVTPDSFGWRGHRAQEVGGIFESALARQLREIGIQTLPSAERGEGFAIQAVPEELCLALSKRSAQVRDARIEFASKNGRQPTTWEDRGLALLDREPKREIDPVALRESWDAAVREHGFAVAEMWDRRVLTCDSEGVDGLRTRLVSELRNHATVTDSHLRQLALRMGAGGCTAAESLALIETMRLDGTIVTLEGGRVSLDTVRKAEGLVLRAADALASSQPIRALGAEPVRDVVKSLERSLSGSLSPAQAQAIARTVADGSSLNIVVGLAGSGKGEVIRGISAAVQVDGCDVLSVATAGETAQRAGEQSQSPSCSIAKVLHRWERGYEPVRQGGVIIVDEAGMVDTFDMRSLLDGAGSRGIRVVLVGDPAQIQAIGAGGTFPMLIERHSAITLGEIHRARHQWMRDAQLAIRAGEAATALGVFHRHGQLHLEAGPREALEKVIDLWDANRAQHKLARSLILVHDTNDSVDLANALAQGRRRNTGELGVESVPSPDRAYKLHAGDLVVFRESPYYPDDGSRRVENGTRGILERIENGQARVILHEPGHAPRSIVVDPQRCPALRLAYASHTMPAQGVTVERSYELLNPSAIDRHSAYVGASRARECHTVVVARDQIDPARDLSDPECIEALAQAINGRGAQDASHAYAIEDRSLLPQHLAAERPAPDIEQSVPQRLQAEIAAIAAERARIAIELREDGPPMTGAFSSLRRVKEQHASWSAHLRECEKRLFRAELELARIEAKVVPRGRAAARREVERATAAVVDSQQLGRPAALRFAEAQSHAAKVKAKQDALWDRDGVLKMRNTSAHAELSRALNPWREHRDRARAVAIDRAIARGR